MNIKIRKLFLASSVGFLLPAVAAAHTNEMGCQNIHARAEIQNTPVDCEYNGTTYDFCFSLKVRGTIKATWVAYGMGDYFVILDPAEFPVPPETESNYNREFNVFNTHRGSFHGDSQYVFDLRIFDVGGGFASPVIVEGGTGIYEDATGFVVAAFLDGDLSSAALVGRVCGPHMPGRRGHVRD
jgi:hypothetical protein